MGYAEKIPVYKYPPGAKLCIPRKHDVVTYDIALIEDFLIYLITSPDPELQIAEYFEQMNQDPFFLVAATGLGKTVGVPTHLLLRGCERYVAHYPPGSEIHDIPRVWVVVPRVMIAEDLMRGMNGLFAAYLERRWGLKTPKNNVEGRSLFGCISAATKRINPDAPIMFITTGLIWPMVKSGDFVPGRDRIVIDEAHVTIEAAVEVEQAVALARHQGLTVDYMSATVESSTIEKDLKVNLILADKRRHPIWMHNLGCKAEDCIVDLVKNTLITPNRDSEHFPKPDYPDYERVMNDVLDGKDRARGLLIMVNSFKGPNSDTVKLQTLLGKQRFERDGKPVTILTIAGEVVRDLARKEAFKAELKRLETEKAPFIVIATSVVEMGISISNLDFVVTYDSGFENQYVEGYTLMNKKALGVNALKQRAGRVGRFRSGICYIARDVGADYTELSDAELNGGGLKNEPIRFPLREGPLMSLALFFKAQLAVNPTSTIMDDLHFPSGCFSGDVVPEEDDEGRPLTPPDRFPELLGQFERIRRLGIIREEDPVNVSVERANLFERWASQYDIAYLTMLQRAFEEEEPKLAKVLFWTVAAACSSITVSDLLVHQGSLPRNDEEREQRDRKLNRRDELVALYQIVRASILFRHDPLLGGERGKQAAKLFQKICKAYALDEEKLDNLVKQVQLLFDGWLQSLQRHKSSKKHQQALQLLFGRQNRVNLAAVKWPKLEKDELEALRYREQDPMDRIAITCRYSKNRNYIQWRQLKIDDRLVTLPGNDAPDDFAHWRVAPNGFKGGFAPGKTPVRIVHGRVYIAKLRVKIAKNRRKKRHGDDEDQDEKAVRFEYDLIHLAGTGRWDRLEGYRAEDLDDDEDDDDRDLSDSDSDSDSEEDDDEEEDDDDEDNPT